MKFDKMDLLNKVLIIRNEGDALKLELALNDGFVVLRADRMPDGLLVSIAKAVTPGAEITAPGAGSSTGGVPTPPEFLPKKP